MRALAILLLLAPFSSGSARCEEPAHAMVVAANQLAAEAGLQILKAGGSAADAAVAVLMALSVVEPEAAGIGGGAELVHFDAGTHAVTAWDGRETAPAATVPSRPDEPARTGGRAVGVPGAVRMLEALHHERGRLPWADLLAPAIRLAEQGVPVSPGLAQAIAAQQDALRRQKPAAEMFFAPDGTPLAPGSTLVNPALAQTLRAIASGGANGLLRGPIAAEIAIAVRSDEQAGLLTTDDLAAYLPHHGDALCIPLAASFGGNTVCSTPPPSGGLMLLQVLGLLGHTDEAAQDPASLTAAIQMIQAEQLAQADTAKYLADPEFIGVPVAALLADRYLTGRSRQIDPLRAIQAEPGEPLPVPTEKAAQKPPPEHGTSSVAIIDAQGNAIAMTASLGGPFGARLFVRGFLLNAALGDFTTPSTPGDPAPANQIQPGKRPATALAPALVLNSGQTLAAAIGSTGGARILAYEAQALTGLLAWHDTPAEALAMPHVAADPALATLEADTAVAALAPDLAALGQTVEVSAMPSATALIVLTSHGPVGVADPRGQGAVAGE
jgi:gamma-glutamyltranspeptidase/glutathione hydrolase